MVLLAEWFVGGLGCPGPNNHTLYTNECFVTRPKQQSFLEKVLVLGLGTPGLSKATRLKKHFGISLEVPGEPGMSANFGGHGCHQTQQIYRVW